MDNRSNLREFIRYGNLLSHDITKLTNVELVDFSNVVQKFHTHINFEKAFRLALENTKQVVALTHE